MQAVSLTHCFRANTQGLTDGGLAGLFWAYIWNFIGFSFVVLSLAEMASMLVAADMLILECH